MPEENKKVVPDPPCCQIQCCRGYFNDSCICTGLGRIGFSLLDENRRWIMRTMTVLAVIATVLSIIPVVSMSTDKGTVKDTYWTYGKVSADNSEVYFSINIVVIETTGPNDTAVNDKYDWDSDSCLAFGDNTDYCEDCNDASVTVRRTVIVNLLTIWLTITTNYKRSDRGSDLNFTKFMAIFSGLLSSIVMISALASYSDLCFSDLPEHTREGASIEYSYGPGFICLLFPQVFKLIEVVFNFATPVPQQMKPLLEGLNEPLTSSDDLYSDF